jgi:hypothetical protein
VLNTFNPMPTTKLTPKAEETSLRILDSALELFRQEGFDNAAIGENDTMNAQMLPKVRMPNRDGFIVRFPNRTP